MEIAGLLALAAVAVLAPKERSFREDVAFLKKYVGVKVLGAPGGPQVAVVPKYQGRVMTSAFGSDSMGFGWINYDLISSGKTVPHINVFGGEDRFWLGPEGGQFSIFFKYGSEFNLETWQTPALIDTEPFRVISESQNQVSFARSATLTNWSNTRFDIGIGRKITLLDGNSAELNLGIKVPKSVRMVAFETDNRLSNLGKEPWDKGSGMLSIWILGMFKPSPTTTIVVPYKEGSESELGNVVNDTYFGKVPADRLKVKGNLILFKGDGQFRSKIGVNPHRALDVLGSYDSKSKVLTIVQYTKPANATEYVNSLWQLQDDPFAGDAANSYNDGPPAPGKKPLGPFYELESSSPAAALRPGQVIRHVHRTFHFSGPEADLAKIALALGADLKVFKTAF